MISNSFIHFKGIGPVGESRLWSRGFISWDDVCERGATDRLAGRAITQAFESRLELARRNAGFFHVRLPARERWRMYEDFLGEVAFLDIETSGGYGEPELITLIGVLDRRGYRSFIRGDNLDQFPEAARDWKLLVTFNGAAFDVPIIEGCFGQRIFEGAGHLDLRFPLARIGYAGGLKSIERQLGVGRPEELSLLSGQDALRLWRLHCEGEPEALATLIRYNLEDVRSLPRLAEIAVDRLAQAAPLRSTSPRRFVDNSQGDLPFDRGLVGFLTRGRALSETSLGRI